MILNVFSVTEIFIGLLSVILMAWGGILAFILAWRWQRAKTAETRSEIEKRSHLVILVAFVVLGIRLFNWPFFYATLQSFVQGIDGAMCIFGVTQVKRSLTGISEIVKPFSFFLIGGWLLTHLLDRKTRTSPLMGRKLYLLSGVAAVVVFGSSVDIALMLKITPGTMVSCCTTVTDILERPTRLVPSAALGTQYASVLGYGYHIGNILLLAGLGVCLWALRTPSSGRWRRPVLGLVFLFAILNAVLFVVTQIEVYAPKIMGLPFHHCLYCLWQYVPDTILMYLLFILGTSAIGWAFLLDLLGRDDETKDALSRSLRTLYGFAIFCLGSAMVMNGIHLVTA